MPTSRPRRRWCKRLPGPTHPAARAREPLPREQARPAQEGDRRTPRPNGRPRRFAPLMAGPGGHPVAGRMAGEDARSRAAPHPAAPCDGQPLRQAPRPRSAPPGSEATRRGRRKDALRPRAATGHSPHRRSSVLGRTGSNSSTSPRRCRLFPRCAPCPRGSRRYRVRAAVTATSRRSRCTSGRRCGGTRAAGWRRSTSSRRPRARAPRRRCGRSGGPGACR